MSALLTWLWARAQPSGSELSILPTVLFGLAFVLAALLASVAFVVFDIHRELAQPEGLLTFLIPMAPWKILVAKWLNLIVSFGLTFVVFSLTTQLFPLPGQDVTGSWQVLFGGFAQGLGPGIRDLVFFLTGMSVPGLVLFILRWTLVLFVGDWAMTLTEKWATRKNWRHGKVFLRVIFIVGVLVALDQVLTVLIAKVPLLLTEQGLLYARPGEVMADLGYLGESSMMAEVPMGETNLLYGTPLVALVYTLAFCLFFLWRSDVNWRRIDR
ncbi:MAG: hypothetical protein SPI19_03285 [Peptoniphilaceae bacterium]|nr:hypothetical protein [Peptoniphilaceae bacterium]